MAREAREMAVVVVVTEEMVRAAIIAQDLKKLTTWAANGQGVRLTSKLLLLHAAGHCSPEMMECLVRGFGADVSQPVDASFGATPLIAAIICGMERNVRCLVKLGAEVGAVNKSGYTSLTCS
jgi:hypothetical protein